MITIYKKLFLFSILCFLYSSKSCLAEANDFPLKNGIIPILEKLELETAHLSLDSSIIYYESVLNKIIGLKATEVFLFKLHIKLGVLYRLKADFSKALFYDIEALKLSEKLQYNNDLGTANNSVGVDYYRMGNYETALTYFLKAAEYRLKSNNTLDIADSYYKLGMVMDDMGKLKEASNYYFMSQKLFEKINNCSGEADVYNGIAGIYYKRNIIDSVEFYALKAMEQYVKCGNKETQAFMYINLASLMNMQKNHKKALDYINKGLEISKEIGALSQIRQAYKNMSETYAYMGDFKKAYSGLLDYNIYKDSIFNIDKTRSFQELTTKYETEKKEHLIVEKQAELNIQNIKTERSQNQRNLSIIISLLVIILLVIIIIRYIEKKRTSLLLDSQNKALSELNATKDKFFAIISHDLKSPIASYERLTAALELSFDKINKEQLKDYISELNKSSKSIHSLLVNLLEWAISQNGKMKFEPQRIDARVLVAENIEQLMSIANEKKIDLVSTIENDIFVNVDKEMMNTVIRNLITNAIKFTKVGGQITIFARKDVNKIFLSIEDNGIGINKKDLQNLFKIDVDTKTIGNSPNKGTGLGLILCQELMKKNNGNIMVVSEIDKGSIFTIELPESLT